MSKLKLGLTPLCALSAAIAVTPRIAAAADTADSSTSLAEIVVTAEKRTEDAIRAPIAISAYGGDLMKDNQVYSAADLQNIDPSINVSKGRFGSTVSIRGVTSADGTSKGTPGIAFNTDGIPLNRGYEQSTGFFDVERVEILKGPQGTLYGQSSTGGALNIITNKPKDEFAASADITVGDYDTRRINGMINVPLSDMFALRAAVNSNSHDAYLVYQDGSPANNDQDDLTSRISLLAKFTDNISLLVSSTNGNIGGLGPGSANYDSLENNSTGSAQRTVYYDPFAHHLDDTYSNWYAQLNATAGFVHITCVGGYFNYSANEESSTTYNPLGNPNKNGGTYEPSTTPSYAWRDYRGHFLTDSHELRFNNETPGVLDWVIGFNWFRENVHESDHNWNANQTADGGYPTIASSQNGIDPLNNTIHTASGEFAQTTWHVTDQWDVIAGVRNTKDEVVRHGTFAPGPGGPGGPWLTPSGAVCIAPADCVGFPNNGTESDSKVTYKAGIAYHFTSTQMLFADVSTGFKGGGFNDSDPRANGGPYPYGPEELTAYEFGYKGRPLDNFEVDADLFYYDYSSRQVSSLINYNGAGVITTNTLPAVIEGLETQFIYRATTADLFDLNVTFLKSHYVTLSEQDPTGATVNLSGVSLDGTPSVAATLGYAHTWTIDGGATVRAHANVKYSSSFYETNLSPYVQYTQGSFTRSNLDLRYTDASGKWYVAAYVQNLENKLQITGAPNGIPNSYITGGGVVNAQSVGITDPRTWGFTLGAKF
jgi:iron complex outermembrane receptor protein